MRTDIVLTLTGPDRVGIVEEVTKALLDLGGNVETSRMARLGGEFAILMLVSLPVERSGSVEAAFSTLASQGYKVTTSSTEPERVPRPEDSTAYRIEVEGADHEGIVHEIAQGLSQQGINIESAETETTSAPLSGMVLFSMTAIVAVPAGLEESGWQAELAEAAERSNVDVTVTLL